MGPTLFSLICPFSSSWGDGRMTMKTFKKDTFIHQGRMMQPINQLIKAFIYYFISLLPGLLSSWGYFEVATILIIFFNYLVTLIAFFKKKFFI